MGHYSCQSCGGSHDYQDQVAACAHQQRYAQARKSGESREDAYAIASRWR